MVSYPTMPRALYTAAVRTNFLATSPLAGATRLRSSEGEDGFEVRGCRVTCRYWSAGGDTVSRQILGCANAIRTGSLACANKDAAMAQVLSAKSEIGIVGPDEAVEKIARQLATALRGVIVSPTTAEVVG